MKIYSKRTFLLGIAALVVAIIMTAASFREFSKQNVLSAEAAWLLFALAMYSATRSPEAVEKEQKRVLQAREVYGKRFGKIGAIMPYVPVLVMVIGICLSSILTERLDVQMLLMFLSMIAGGFLAMWLRDMVNSELKEQEKHQNENGTVL